MADPTFDEILRKYRSNDFALKDKYINDLNYIKNDVLLSIST
jgi:hypothetical protein